jgi:hypothetical protein
MTPPIPSPALARSHKPPSENHYCATCHRTRAFVDHGPVLDCPLCRHRLYRVLDGAVAFDRALSGGGA